MEVHLTVDVQAKLEPMAYDAGKQLGELIEDAVIGLYDELVYTREMLDRRCDDSGQSSPDRRPRSLSLLMERTQRGDSAVPHGAPQS